MNFQSTILTIPGIGGSGPAHWQSLWEKEHGFTRVEQRDWDTPNCAEWVEAINNHVQNFVPSNLIVVAHSAACVAFMHWVQKYNVIIKGALLVAPADADAASFPGGTTGFAPVPMIELPFPSIVVTSSNDHFVTLERAKQFADAWGSDFINIGEAGHINVASGFGEWEHGLTILKRLDSL
ncbi:RBBP9/YdeN family alpha/beta hydrolase [Mucilaginibacter sp.]|jgi:predicted alpha/beta hydrolase family esterase|uniref:RBBP9/YdeN family alpha/beta hydrolase n=1 Tax=Mucilaginibacter sp. TaxID=1882438 RepID=UPI002BFD7106|nr:alpha/beta hydrolase [Mucilaginibacter sp.]HTI61244.1 alpha/beta hydrolase [Mucilaginibacter sp.]